MPIKTIVSNDAAAHEQSIFPEELEKCHKWHVRVNNGVSNFACRLVEIFVDKLPSHHELIRTM